MSYEVIEEDDSFLENSDFSQVYEQLFSNVIQQCNFRSWYDILRILNKNDSTTPSAKNLQTRTYNLLKKCLNNMLENHTENCSVSQEHIHVEIYGLNYPDPERQGEISVSFCIEEFMAKLSDVFVFNEAPEELHLSHDERITSLENRVKVLEKKIGI